MNVSSKYISILALHHGIEFYLAPSIFKGLVYEFSPMLSKNIPLCGESFTWFHFAKRCY